MASIHVTRRLTDAAHARLAELDHEVTGGTLDEPPDRATLLDAVQGAAAIVSTVTERIDAEVLAAAGRGLQVVANVAVGLDNVDLEAARAAGVTVTNTPDVLTDATADVAFGLIIDACRRLSEGDRFLRAGTPWIWGPRFFLGRPVAGSTLGIVGYGRIGQAVARRARGFDMEILATGGRYLAQHGDADGVATVELDELLDRADVVSLHCPLTDATRGLIGVDELERMKATAVLVNTARGPVVDEDALVQALRNGSIAAAGLDVYRDEPALHPGLTYLDNVVLAPHVGSADVPTRDAMGVLAVDNVAAVLAGEPPLTPVR